MTPPRNSSVCICTLLASLATYTYALTSDQDKILHINSNSATIDYRSGVSHFIGHAIATQGSTTLSGEEITTYRPHTQKITKLTANSSATQKACYQTLPEENQKKFIAKANQIVFYTSNQVALLHGHASAEQGQNHFQGQSLIYNIREKEITTSSNQQLQSRVVYYPA